MSSGSNEERVALIALGSNLGYSAGIIQEAMDELEKLSSGPIRRSRPYRSAPVDCPPASPEFVNAAVLLYPAKEETPETLLQKLQELEKRFGREPKLIHNEPRPLDLDLIAFGRETRNTPGLVLPHPRAHLRRFVLEPLAEVAPYFILPGQTQNILELSTAL